MFSQATKPLLALAVASLIAIPAQAAIAILDPNSSTTWYKNNTVLLTWSAGADDPSPVRILCNTPSGNENFTLADQIPTTLSQLTVLLPQVPPGEDYTIAFVNGSNPGQVYAESQAFKIEEGTAPSSTSGGSAAGSSTVNIPGPYTPFTTAPTTSNPSSSSTTSTGAATKMRDTVGFGGMLLGLVVAMGV